MFLLFRFDLNHKNDKTLIALMTMASFVLRRCGVWGVCAVLCLAPVHAKQETALPAQDDRIIALGGSITEIVYALGEEHRLVGVDQSSIYPAAARALPQLGYFRQLSSEGVLSLNPSLVMALEGTGPQAALDQLRAAGVAVFTIPAEPSVAGARRKIRAVAAALHREEGGERLVARLEADLEQARRAVASASTRPRVLFIYARGGGTLNVSGRGTSADAMLALAGGINAVTAYEDYRPLTAEAVVAAAPDVILLLDGGLDAVGGVDGLLRLPGLALTPAGRARRIVSMDDALFLNFASRLGQAVLQLNKLLYPAMN
jgi:iron complex transport system substrate-binding protein